MDLPAGPTPIHLWKEHSPAKVHPNVAAVQGLTHRGGGRGYIATADIPVGALILEEAPFIYWPKKTGEMTLNTAVVTMILSNARVDEFLSALKFVHPVDLAEVPPALVETLLQNHGKDIEDLAEKHPKVGKNEVMRIYFVLQMSSFGSGLYLHFSLFNHDCHPNCIKFVPQDASGSLMSKRSQVRATRPIKKGDEITLSYLDPLEQTSRVRKRALMTQFGFEPNYSPVAVFKNSLVEKLLNPDNPENDAFLEECESQLAKGWPGAEDRLAEIMALSEEADKILDPRHVLLLRINKLLLTELNPKLSDEGDDDDTNFGYYLKMYLVKAYEVYQTQAIWLYKDHIDLATTLNDLAMSLQSMLSWDKNSVFETFPQWNNFNSAAKFQHQCQENFNRIKNLYE